MRSELPYHGQSIAQAWLAPEPVPVSVLEGWLVDGADARDALAELASWSLVSWTADADGLTVHRRVQEITRQRLPNDQKHDTLGLALAILDGGLPSPEWDEEGWKLWERLIPHCRTLLDHLCNHALEPKATRIMNDLALWLDDRTEHGEAEPLYRRALAIDETSFGPEHPNVARDLNNLARLISGTDRLAAEPLYRWALAIYEKSFGPEHPDVAIGLNSLALLLSATNRLAEAEPLYRRVLRILAEFAHRTGYVHRHMQAAINNYDALLSARGLWQDAIAARVRSAIADESA